MAFGHWHYSMLRNMFFELGLPDERTLFKATGTFPQNGGGQGSE
jgi:hypothetical protein